MHVFWDLDFKWILGGSWKAPGPILEGFGRLPCASWTALGRSWGAPGRFGLPLGGSWGVSWALLVGLADFLGSFWFPGTPQASILEGSGTCWARFWKAPGECFGMPFSAPRTSLRNALINAVTTLFHLPALLILPSGAAVCAQHMDLVASTLCQCDSYPSGPLLEPPYGLMLAHFSLSYSSRASLSFIFGLS